MHRLSTVRRAIRIGGAKKSEAPLSAKSFKKFNPNMRATNRILDLPVMQVGKSIEAEKLNRQKASKF